MITRLLKLSDDESFFLFGPKGAGKTTLLKHLPLFRNALYIDLLKSDEKLKFASNPDLLETITNALPEDKTHVIIDEVQKIPKMLDIVHHLIETTDKKFILTASNISQLRAGKANLLGGRAFVYHLYPFSFLEIEHKYAVKTNEHSLKDCLNLGMLPKSFECIGYDKKRFLEDYRRDYLAEEVRGEPLQLDSFEGFLKVAAKLNGKIIYFSHVSRYVSVGADTVRKYFSLLEDTFMGFFLEGFQHPSRKNLIKAPKFYFFDPGVANALADFSLPVKNRVNFYGEAFKHFVITQSILLAEYYDHEYKFYHLVTTGGVEVDLVVERPGQKTLFINIKNASDIRIRHLMRLKNPAKGFESCEIVCLSRDRCAEQLDGIMVYPWAEGIERYFGASANLK